MMAKGIVSFALAIAAGAMVGFGGDSLLAVFGPSVAYIGGVIWGTAKP